MKKNLLWVTALLTFGTVAAMADELPNRPAYFITSPLEATHWTGFYIGGNGGFGFGNSSVNYAANDPAAQLGTCGGGGTPRGQCIPSMNFRFDGAVAGGQIGFNWQINSLWVVGAEADYDWSHIDGTANSPFRLGGAGNTNMIAGETLKSFGTVRARMGAVPFSSLLLYGTGGLAYGRVGENLNVVRTGSLASGGFSYSCAAAGPACFAGSPSQMVWGWAAGAGADFAVSNNLILRTELLYVHLAAASGMAVAQGTLPAGPTPASLTATFSPERLAILRVGFSYKF